MENRTEATPLKAGGPIDRIKKEIFFNKASTFLKVVTLSFVVLEFSGVIVLWFVKQCDLGYWSFALAVCNFEGWQIAEQEGEQAVLNQMEFYSYYVGNNKFMMALLLIVCALSNDVRTNQMAGMVGALGCALYFPKMEPLMKMMLNDEEVSATIANSTYWIIVVSFLLWTSATVAFSLAIKWKNNE